MKVTDKMIERAFIAFRSATESIDKNWWRAALEAALDDIPEPPKPVLCKHCGREILQSPSVKYVWYHKATSAENCGIRAEPPN